MTEHNNFFPNNDPNSFQAPTKFYVREFQEQKGIYFGKSVKNFYCVFFPSESLINKPTLSTKKVSYKEGGEYKIIQRNELISEGKFDSLLCTSSNELEQEIFITLVKSYISDIKNFFEEYPSPKQFFKILIELFTIDSQKNKFERQLGLWGELFFMKSFVGFKYWIKYWHNDVDSKFDFSNNNNHIEVKITTLDERIHYFNHKQLYNPDRNIFIVSIMGKDGEKRISLNDLISECRKSISSFQDELKLERAIFHCGLLDPDDNGPSYDENLSKDSILSTKAENIPHFLSPEPIGVLQTHYRVDLGFVESLGIEELFHYF